MGTELPHHAITHIDPSTLRLPKQKGCDGRQSARHHGIVQGDAALHVWQQPGVGPLATRPAAATASIDASAHDVRCSATHPSSRSQDRTVRQRPRQRAAGAGPCATRLEVHNTTASSEASSASLSVSASLSTALLRHCSYCRRSAHHGGWQASGRLSLRRLRRPSHSAAHECNACERVH